ncbi:hypothetical protein ANANG_G00267470 [Anguilla anguilla]|uniref:VPS9 domain-containing protein n=1 Tax=Anguilla anguilla TaxID=7936 RepID=A0A9D3LTQ8_ANGAN|nr:hypothetical protein ANANG_G00267470 [Anguilla anguilla]
MKAVTSPGAPPVGAFGRTALWPDGTLTPLPPPPLPHQRGGLPAECCQHARSLEDAQFVDGYKALGFRESAYGEFLGRLRDSPRLLASCLAAGQRLNQERALSVLHCVFASLYGNCVMPEDEAYLLQVLRYLIDLELKPSEDPRRLLCRSTCAFSVLFRLFSEGLYGAKLFLTAALHEPLRGALAEGGGGGGGAEARATCAHLLLACFVCPAVVDPEQYGIVSDAPVNEASRFNLMQVAQLLQQFGMADQDEAPSLQRSSLSKFDKSSLAAFLDAVIGGRVAESPPVSSSSLLEGLSRTAVYVTQCQLFTLVDFVQSVMEGDQLSEDERQALESLLSSIPQAHPATSSSCLELTPANAPQLSPGTTPANKKNRLPIGQQLAAITSWEPSAAALSTHIPLVTGFTSRSRSRSSLAQEGEQEASSQDSLQEVMPEEVLVISLGSSPQNVPGMMSENEVLSLQMAHEGQGEGPADDGKLQGKPDKTLRFSLCSDNLEGISEGPSNRSNSVSSLDLEGESVSELGAGPAGDGVEALQLLEHEQATTQDNLDDKLRKFEIRDMMGLTDDRDISETVSETWSTDVLGSDFDPNADEDRLQEIAGAACVENMLGSLLCLPGSGSLLLDPCTGSTISETTSEAWSVEVLPSDSEAADLKQEERLQELESCSGVGSTSDDTEVREVSSRPSTPGLSAVSGVSMTSEDIPNKTEDLRSECSSDFGGKDSATSPEGEEPAHGAHHLASPPSHADMLVMFDPLASAEGFPTGTVVRPKAHHVRPPHPPPDPPIPEAYAVGQEPRLSLFMLGSLGEAEPGKQRYSCPDRLVRSRSSDITCPARRPTSDPGVLRRGVADDRDHASAFGLGPTSSPSRDYLREGEERKDSDDEKADRSRPWWKKRFVNAIPKGAGFRRKDKHEREEAGLERAHQEDAGSRLSTQVQAAEDILDKYRNIKRSSPSEGAPGAAGDEGPDTCGEGESSMQESLREDALQNLSTEDMPDSASQTAPPQDHRYTFSDAKKKLRLALCSADSVVLPLLPHASTRNGLPDHAEPEENEIVCFLKVQLAEAINLQDKNSIAQIQETTRCISRLDSRTCRKLLTAIADDYRKRAPYIAYLTRCRQGLQTSQAHLERMLQRVLRDKDVANRCFTAVCVRLFLQGMEAKMQGFIKAFQRCTASDDKTAAVEDFLRYLYGAMANDATWQYASEEQLQDAQAAIERSVMNRIFRLAFYPNQDGDVLRDQLLQEHIQRLSKVVTANHKALQIPEVYLKEAPWPSAQAEIRSVNAYKTPRDKVQCILRMCSTIMNLLSLANEDSVPGADDFVPALVFVLIKANPPCLLSTVQYINNFYASRLSGEECYWWMQFTAAVEFIKTIDDRDRK